MDAKVLYNITYQNTEFKIYDNQIIHIIYPDYVQINGDLARKGVDLIKELNIGPHYYIAEFRGFTDLSKEAKKHYSSPETAKTDLCHAVILKNSALKILANSYVAFNKPVTPTRFFSSFDDAYTWVEKLKKKKLIHAKVD